MDIPAAAVQLCHKFAPCMHACLAAVHPDQPPAYRAPPHTATVLQGATDRGSQSHGVNATTSAESKEVHADALHEQDSAALVSVRKRQAGLRVHPSVTEGFQN